MKKYEYKFVSYSFGMGKLYSSDLIKAFNKEGADGWELVQWELYEERLNIFNTKRISHVTATWKREINN